MRAGIGRSVMTNETTHIVIVIINRCHPSRDARNTDIENNVLLQVPEQSRFVKHVQSEIEKVKTWHKKNLH